MLNAPESLNAAPTQSLRAQRPAARNNRKSAESPALICDLADAEAFIECHRKPHVPILSAFGAGRLHVCRLFGSWDLDKAAAENASALFRSIRKVPGKDALQEWDDLTFQFGPKSFLYADKDRIVGFATTPVEAERLAKQFGKAYAKPAAASGGTFYLIEHTRSEIKCQPATLPADTILAPDTFSLHYGNGSWDWHQDFVKRLRHRNNGLSVFEGQPGTGKTFYLRHLMGVLQESHRFYFIPTANLGVLSKPEFIGFWAEQRRHHAERKFVVILEDSDAALMTRGADNREQVSAILNLSDGMLADFLRLQIICTINCSAADIDPALLRPGRLICHRVFRRLDYAQATRLAGHLGRKLPVPGDYSLAEVLAGDERLELKRPPIGFAV